MRREKPGVLGLGIGEIALRDPRLAYTLCQVRGVGPQALLESAVASAVGGLEILNITGRWTTGDANQSIPGDLDDVAEVDLLLCDIEVSVRRPNYLPGNALRDQANYFYSKNPDIDFTLIIKSWCNYAISLDPTPLGNLDGKFCHCCPVGLVMTCGASVKATFTNIRALTAGEIPTIATVSMFVSRLPTGCYTSVTVEAAVNWLKQHGVYPGSSISCPD